MDVKRMYCMIEKLAECAEKQFDAGIENIDTSEMGQVVDMMKDLAEAMYYRELTKAMQEFDAEDVMEMLDRYGDGRKFYDHYRYADGRFAPKGRGHRMGYRPYLYMGEDDWLNEYTHNPDFMKPGYTERGKMDSRHGRSYDRFDENRRFYHESGDAATKKRMEDSIKDVFDDMESMVQDVWKDMTPEQKTQYRAKMTQLVQKMQ